MVLSDYTTSSSCRPQQHNIVDEFQKMGENLQRTMRSWPMNSFGKDYQEVKSAANFTGLTNRADDIEIEVTTTTTTSFMVLQPSTRYTLKFTV